MNTLPHTPSRSRTASDNLARALGWLSIGLGLFELLAPRRMSKGVGMHGRERLIRLYGAREVATGIGLLAATPRAPWLWARVAGDVIDAGTLVAYWRPRAQITARVPRTAFALGAVAGIAVADVATALRLSAREWRGSLKHDYSKRSGFPRPAEQMRGLGRKNGGGPAAPLAGTATRAITQ